MTVLRLHPPIHDVRPEGGHEWVWVLATPFRAHVRSLLTAHALPWRAFAGYADVPDNVVRSLLGRPGRSSVRRIAPHYAQALMHIDHPRLSRDLASAAPDLWVSAATRLLHQTGWPAGRIAHAGELSEESAAALLTGRAVAVTRRNELLLLATLRAHGVDLDVLETSWAA